jgi:ATP-dependent Lon protease
MRQLFAEEEVKRRLEWARGLRPEAAVNVVRALERAAELGHRRRTTTPASSKVFEQLKAAFPNFGEVCDFVWRRAVLAGSAGDGAFRIPPILLNGPPGVGKTEFSTRLASWLGTHMTRVDMAALDASFKLTGLDCGFSTGRPGVVWDVLQSPCMSPVVILDELDKRGRSTSDEGVSFLLSLLEPSTATRFEDSCIGLPIDASWIHWIGTCNDASAIEPAVASRFRVFNVAKPTDEESMVIVQSVYEALRQREQWARAFPEQLPPEVRKALATLSAREVWQALEEACANAVIRGRRELRVEDMPRQRSDGRRSMGFTP